MNSKDELTPEEKLLHLIRRSDKKSPKEKKTEQVAQHREDKFTEPKPSSVDIKSPKFKEAKIVFSGIKSVNFVLINRLIILAVFVALTLFSFDLYFYSPEISKSLSSLWVTPHKISLKVKEIKPYSYYQQEISKRNLFKAGSLDSATKKVVPTGSTFKELMKDLQLLGIVSGDNPQIIIEDKKLQKTYFLYRGDYIGEIKVEEIHSDRATLEFRGEKISLFL